MVKETCQICPISGESPEEERVNHYTHLMGLLLSLVGCPILLVNAFLYGDFWNIVSCSLYAITLISLYAASTYYHNCRHIHTKGRLRILDHACIYLLIAGTYTPFTLGPLREHEGWILFYVVWGIALIGVVFKIFAIHRFERLSTFAYMGMGWLIVFSFSTLMEMVSWDAITWMIAGGLVYSFGILFYLWDSLPFNHAIWHLFVLGGSFCHYCSVLVMVQSNALISLVVSD